MRVLLLLVVAALGFSPATASAKTRTFDRYVEGKLSAPRPGQPSGGLLLMGGGDRNHDAMRWFFAKAGNGHIVILRASYAGEIGKEFVKEIGGVASAETFVFHDRAASADPRILAALRRADGIFIAGGDQANYVRYWKGTEIARLLTAHVAAGKPIAGTSAGLAMLGEALYGASDGGSIKSPEALASPFGPANTIERDFLDIALLKGVVTDTHFKERDRLGRLFAFVAKAQVGRPSDAPAMIGVGVDESAAVAVEADGRGRVYATEPDGGAWIVDGSALRVAPTRGALVADRIKVTVMNTQSVLHLPSGRVDNPASVRRYAAAGGEVSEMPRWSLAIHGGAGVIERGALTPAKEAAYRAGLAEALRAGGAVLDRGGPALDAVAAAVRVLEDNPLFNAGRGAVFTAEGRNELDAAIMDGATQKAGAVAGVTRTRHPIDLARAVMDKTRHVMLSGAGADRFSVEQGLEQVAPEWFRTEERWQQLQAWRNRQAAAVDRTHLFGTVGAVALDADGNLAAATSTGGMTGKRWGRVGDSPIIGAGTYARDGRCAVSGTGKGEYFIRYCVGHEIASLIAYRGLSLKEATDRALAELTAHEIGAGLVAVGADGTIVAPYNTGGMYRGWVTQDGLVHVATHGDVEMAGQA